MALNDRYTGSIIISDDLTTSWTAHDEAAGMAGDGWDTLKITYYKLSETMIRIEDVMAAFPIGNKLGARRFWLTGFDGPTCVADGLFRLTASYKGLADDKPIVTSYGATANQQSGENILVGGNIEPKVTVYENGVTASARYVLENYALAPTDEVGTAKAPADAPAIGASNWAFLTESTYNYPNGWVLMGCTTDPLPGTTVAFVTDSYQWIQERTP